MNNTVHQFLLNQHNAVHLQRLAAKSAASCQGIPKHIQRPAICGHCIPPEVHSISHFSEFSLYTNRIQRDNTQRSLSFCGIPTVKSVKCAHSCTPSYNILSTHLQLNHFIYLAKYNILLNMHL